MIFAKIALIFLALLDPSQSAAIAANALKAPSVAPALVKICHRESRCRPVKIHSIDRAHSERVYRKAVKVGWLDPKCQPPKKGAYSTRGSFGLMFAYHAHFIAPCIPPEYFDVPIISAFAAAMKLIEHCDRSISNRHSATSRWAFNDRICRRVPRRHARSAEYQIARSTVRDLLYVLNGTEAR